MKIGAVRQMFLAQTTLLPNASQVGSEDIERVGHRPTMLRYLSKSLQIRSGGIGPICFLDCLRQSPDLKERGVAETWERFTVAEDGFHHHHVSTVSPHSVSGDKPAFASAAFRARDRPRTPRPRLAARAGSTPLTHQTCNQPTPTHDVRPRDGAVLGHLCRFRSVVRVGAFAVTYANPWVAGVVRRCDEVKGMALRHAYRAGSRSHGEAIREAPGAYSSRLVDHPGVRVRR